MSTPVLNGAEGCRSLLEAWNKGQEVTSVRMAAENAEGYEQQIQALGMKILATLSANGVLAEDFDDPEKHRQIRAQYIDPVTDTKISGCSMHQIGAAINLASVFYAQGYEKAITTMAKPDRLFNVKKPYSPQ